MIAIADEFYGLWSLVNVMFFVLLLPTLDFGCEILEMYHLYDEAQLFVHVSINLLSHEPDYDYNQDHWNQFS